MCGKCKDEVTTDLPLRINDGKHVSDRTLTKRQSDRRTEIDDWMTCELGSLQQLFGHIRAMIMKGCVRKHSVYSLKGFPLQLKSKTAKSADQRLAD